MSAILPQLVCFLSLPPATKLGQGYIFTGVCDSVHGGACVVAGRGKGAMRGCQGACMVARGHVWLPGGACVVAKGCAWLPGVCVVAGGACMVAGGHVWLLGGMHGCWEACMVARGCA